MQPYFFPYIGYFQLIDSVDCFYVFDDVNYIKKGWINRNYLQTPQGKQLFVVPIQKASQNRKINNHILTDDQQWKSKLLKTIELNYSKKKCYKSVIDLIKEIIFFEDNNLSSYLVNSIRLISKYLDIKTIIHDSTSKFENQELSGEQRIIDICKKSGATTYHNPIGGKDLYDKNHFKNEGLNLKFVEPTIVSEEETEGSYNSILDLMMNKDKGELLELLKQYKLQ